MPPNLRLPGTHEELNKIGLIVETRAHTVAYRWSCYNQRVLKRPYKIWARVW